MKAPSSPEFKAAIDLVGRAGARELELGYLHDDVPIEEMSWYAQAKYGGNRIIVEDKVGPVEALEELAARIMTGAKCKCGKLVALSDLGATAFEWTEMADGSTWTIEEARRAGLCRWRRLGDKWYGACGAGR